MLKMITAHKEGQPFGIYAICSANKFVLEAAIIQAKADNTALLIESTSNQVNQSGGYMGLSPRQFVDYVKKIARSLDFSFDRIILGGDHLGPKIWCHENASNAIRKCKDLIGCYIKAGYSKIHIDASTKCADDAGDPSSPLDYQIIAERTADLCAHAEKAYIAASSNKSPPYYVIGADVPNPGGACEKLNARSVSRVKDVKQTIELTKRAFVSQGVESAWNRVIAVVVQPGVEFCDKKVIEYSHSKALRLSKFIENYRNLVYEAHSTDFQLKAALRQMVKDHFAILKVGPSLTFAFREAVFALAQIEREWLARKKNISYSQIRQVLDKTMCHNTIHWQKYYKGSEAEVLFARKFSYSDRCRYYWQNPDVSASLSKLLKNLTESPIHLTLLSQYMPEQYQAVREGRIGTIPIELIRHKIAQIIKTYSYACGNT